MLKDFIAVDLEMTGLNPKSDKIIEIGAIKYSNGVEAGRFVTFINPGRNIPEPVVRLTGITDELIKDAPQISEVIQDFLTFAQDYPLLGHGIIHDYSFLKKACVDNRLKFERRGVDTLRIARRLLPEMESRTLSHLCDHYNIALNAHRAVNDAEATIRLYEKMWEEFGDANEDAFDPGILTYNVKRDTPITKAQKERIEKYTSVYGEECVKKFLPAGCTVNSLTRSEADRMIDRLLADRKRPE